jgi:hypothetical protein
VARKLPSLEFLQDVTHDNVGFAKFINENYDLDISAEQINSVFVLAPIWAESDGRAEVMSRLEEEIKDTVTQIGLGVEEYRKICSEPKGVGRMGDTLKALTKKLDKLNYEYKFILKHMDNGNRQRVPWKKVG